ncbi:MAG TPA: 2-hydroxychromene-2-carboxylate isomerase [Myxococcota bacterium]|nr:2-hydroxychromene-2-carboxylate isomerase [Myxococcota bacterium]
MAGAPVRFLFDYISHNAYLAWTQIGPLAERYGRAVEPEAVLFAGLLNAHGQLGPAEVPPKARWMMLDVARKGRRLGVPIAPPKTHPFPPLLALRVTHAAAAGAPRRKLIDGLFRAAWGESRDVSDPAEVSRIAQVAGLDGERLVEEAATDAVKAQLRDATERALGEGVFGVPTMLVDGELFWGFDDFAHLELALAGRDPLQPGDRERFTRYSASARRRRPEEK